MAMKTVEEVLNAVFSEEGRPAAVIQLRDGYSLVVEVHREKGFKKYFLRLAIVSPDNDVVEDAEVPIDRVDRLKQPRYDTFRAMLKKLLPENTSITDLQSFIKTRVAPKLLEMWRGYVSRLREERRKRLEELAKKYMDEVAKIEQDPIGYALETLKYLHVGDEDAKKVLLLVIASRYLPRENRLAAVVMGPSSAGKNHLVNAVKRLTPKKWWFVVTRFTPRALDYLPKSLGRQILYIQEYEGLKDASYSVRVTVSEGELVVAYVARDPKTGEMKTIQKKILGTPIIITTTTRIELDEDMENRTVFVYPDTSADQTKSIIEYHKKLASDADFKQFIDDVVKKRCRAFKVYLEGLEKLDVLIPEELLNEFNDIPLTVRARRDFPRLISFIKSHAVLNQRKRKILEINGKRYIVAEKEDVEFVKKNVYPMLKELMEGLKKPHKDVYNAVRALLEGSSKRYVTAREVQAMLKGYSYRYVKDVLDKLVEMGYLTVDTSSKPYKYTIPELINSGGGLGLERFARSGTGVEE